MFYLVKFNTPTPMVGPDSRDQMKVSVNNGQETAWTKIYISRSKTLFNKQKYN